MKDNKTKITIVGTGAFGTAIAEAIVSNPLNKIILYGVDQKEIDDINDNKKNSKYYGGLKLSENLKATSNKEEAFNDTDIIFLAVPSSFVKTVLEETIIPNMTKAAYFINLAKGLDFLKVELLSDSIKEIVPKNKLLGVLKLAGGSFAIELAEKVPTLFSLACEDLDVCEDIRKHLISETVNVTCTDNIRGIEAVSVIKNALAILLGIVWGLDYKMNAKAYMFTESLNEMARILKLFKVSNPEKLIFQPAGVGDLFLTGTSKHSRNFETGFQIGKEDKVSKDVLSTFTTIEGLRTIEILMMLREKEKVHLPLIELVYNITYKKEKPSIALKDFFQKYRKV